jgi:hypothetical protein
LGGGRLGRGCGFGGFARLDRLDSSGTKEEHQDYRSSHNGNFAMSESAALSDADRYEQACDQAIAMCDGNLRSTIKALIMANEYLEAELQEVQMAALAACAPAGLSRIDSDAA